MNLHSNIGTDGRSKGDTTEIVKLLHKSYGNFGHIEGTHMQHSFSPLAHQGCLYYTNVRNGLIAKAMCRMVLVDKETDIAVIGCKLRQSLLEVGLAKDAGNIIKAFVGGDLIAQSFSSG